MVRAGISFALSQLLHHNIVYHNVLWRDVLGLCVVKLHVLLVVSPLVLCSLDLLVEHGLILGGITMLVLMALTGKIGLRGDSVEGRKSLALRLVDVHVLELWLVDAGQLFELQLSYVLPGRHFLEHRLFLLVLLEADVNAVFYDFVVIFSILNDFSLLFALSSDVDNFLVDMSLMGVV